MAELSVGRPTGEQGATQNPQTAPAQTIGAPKQSGGVQPGTSASLLTDDKGGVGLQNQPLTTVSLNAATTAAVTQGPSAKPSKHQVNAALFILPVALCVVAVAMFWFMRSTAKSTTN